MRVAFVGCTHGDLDAIYEEIRNRDVADIQHTELLICPGDFQACRDASDMRDMKMPEKYREMKDFGRYYRGEVVAPILTLFVGGNHEASGHLLELPHGGWVAPNIYYMGRMGVVRLPSGLSVAGLSGIYKPYDYNRGYVERAPLTEKDKVSVLHVRRFAADVLSSYPHPVDILVTHDWPSGIEQHGDLETLLKQKPFFRQDIERGELGSPAAHQCMVALRPQLHSAAHLHVRFEAKFDHQESTTNFLALDKPGRRRSFLEIRELTPRAPPLSPWPESSLAIDSSWVDVIKACLPATPHTQMARFSLPDLLQPTDSGPSWGTAPPPASESTHQQTLWFRRQAGLDPEEKSEEIDMDQFLF
ncbi:MAG: hypothetical protein KVP17_002119 [Porospora cf. gigantea B]|uniref:uncharacterized protein n=1 Tax=Porospora cf. gigantea B TaxID=2853592 RepID=UPI003571DAD4|nr:MAG: hypothetical protein KVP17_002119 [Porospora cf. gigantea B]